MLRERSPIGTGTVRRRLRDGHGLKTLKLLYFSIPNSEVLRNKIFLPKVN